MVGEIISSLVSRQVMILLTPSLPKSFPQQLPPPPPDEHAQVISCLSLKLLSRFICKRIRRGGQTCRTYSLQEAKDKISLCKMDGFPPKVVFSVIISKEFEINCFNGADRVLIRSFLHFLQSWKHTHNLIRF